MRKEEQKKLTQELAKRVKQNKIPSLLININL